MTNEQILKIARDCGVVPYYGYENELQRFAKIARADLEAEVERWKVEHGIACKLVADMHEAAIGYVGGPIRGVLEDVADLRIERDEYQAAADKLAAENKELREAVPAVVEILELIAYEAPISGNHLAQARVLMAAKMIAAAPAVKDKP